jgi:glycine/D-amino acid oxidase-like deaminating enzyme
LAETQVCILGGGIGGLWLQYELARQGFDSVLIDCKELCGYASTRNQAWLHSGAYYGVIGGTTDAHGVARVCEVSSKLLKQFCADCCPHAIDEHSGCLFVFDSERARDKLFTHISPLNVNVQRVDRSFIEKKEPLINSEYFPFGIDSAEGSFDAREIAKALQAQCGGAGSRIYISRAELLEATIHHDVSRSQWSIQIDDQHFSAKTLVAAAGVLNPALLAKINGRTADMPIERSFIGVFDRRVTKGIVVLRHSKLRGTIMFGPAADRTTVNVEEENIDTHIIGDLQPGPIVLENFANRLGVYTNLTEAQMHFYICEKLNNTDDARNPFPRAKHGNRHYFWTEEDNGFFCVYPGKFIAAPLLAKKLAQKLKGYLDVPWHSAPDRQLSAKILLAKAPFQRRPTHVTSRNQEGRWEINRI